MAAAASSSSPQAAEAADGATLPAQLWRLSAVDAVAALKKGLVTPLQLVEAAEERWKETDPIINAMPVTCWEQAKAEARTMMAARGGVFSLDRQSAGGAHLEQQQLEQEQEQQQLEQQGLFLYGLPIAVKDVQAVAGLPFTSGSRVYQHRIAAADDPLVARLRRRGAIVVGKTNTPEWAAGSQTYNSLFGTTLNPFDARLTAGGSSGGSAAAVAVGQVPLATGTDLGGSLRNPAAFCGVVGMRCSVGLVPMLPLPGAGDKTQSNWRLQNVAGWLARSVADLALALQVSQGPSPPGDPAARPLPPPGSAARELAATAAAAAAWAAGGFVGPPPAALAAVRRVAFSEDLGVPPVCPRVAAACRAAAAWWARAPPDGPGAAEVVVAAAADEPPLALQEMPRAFQLLRAAALRGTADLVLDGLTPEERALLKPELLWQVEQARGLQPADEAWAVAAHDRALAARDAFFERFDLLLCPTVMCQPFDATIHWPRSFAGHELPTYVCWLKACSLLSPLDVPAISVPCALIDGVPCGLQIVGPPGDEARVLAAAAAFEAAHGFARLVPVDPQRPCGEGEAG